jgi:hypothetical protein
MIVLHLGALFTFQRIFPTQRPLPYFNLSAQTSYSPTTSALLSFLLIAITQRQINLSTAITAHPSKSSVADCYEQLLLFPCLRPLVVRFRNILTMAPSPTDLEAWSALQAHVSELDKVRKPKELKEHMYNVVRRTWDMSEQTMEYFVDFGVIWIDMHYRQLCNKMAEIGPGRETFDIATYRTLKTSRLDGVCVFLFVTSCQRSMPVERFSIARFT